MDDCDFMEWADTQLLELSDNPVECNSNEEDTQQLTFPDGYGDLTIFSAHECHQYDERLGTESLLSSDRSQNSDLLRVAMKKDESGSCSSSFGSVFSRCSSATDYSGKINVEKTDLHHGKGNDNKRVSSRTRSKVARSLAKVLFTNNDATEKGSHDIESDRLANMIQLPTCGDEMALEFGELSEVNALKFVDKFLKINVWESELENIPKKCVNQTVGSEVITKGPKTLAQKASWRSARVGGSAFDWDDTKEDESGGEFFIKNKEVLVGIGSDVGKCGTKSQEFMVDESRVSQSLGKFKNVEERRKIHGTMMNFVHSDSKLVKCGQIHQFETKSNAKVDNYKNEQVGVSPCFRDDSNFTVKKQKDGGRKRGGNTKVKKSSIRIRPRLSNSDTCNISKQTKQMRMKSRQEGSVASRTRSQYATEEFKVDVLKPKENYRRSITKCNSTENERESSGKEHFQSKIGPSTEVKGGRNNGKCRNRSGMASEISEAGVEKSNLNCMTQYICMEDEYFDSSCRKKLSLKTELPKLRSNERIKSSLSFNDLRQRSDNGDVRVFFCQSFSEDIVKQQKKIISQLGFSVASSISDATHFVADAFVCTRNMLEAIAGGKPVVTRLWLESCGRVGCLVDEINYILRDVEKERGLGFSMPCSLARATCQPLLEGRRVLVTPHVKPSVDIISSLVKAVHGQVTKRLCRTNSESERFLSDMLVLSCEEDFEDCVPLLEKGIAIYSSDLLLNGIITQKLDYERYRIFVDRVKKTRFTLWVKKDGDQFVPCKRKKSQVPNVGMHVY